MALALPFRFLSFSSQFCFTCLQSFMLHYASTALAFWTDIYIQQLLTWLLTGLWINRLGFWLAFFFLLLWGLQNPKWQGDGNMEIGRRCFNLLAFFFCFQPVLVWLFGGFGSGSGFGGWVWFGWVGWIALAVMETK